MEESDWEGSCVICGEIINMPICVSCMEKEIVSWLANKEPEMVQLLRGITSFFEESEEKTSCIICGSKMGTCSRCFIDEVYGLLAQKDLELANELAFYFNPDLWGLEAN